MKTNLKLRDKILYPISGIIILVLTLIIIIVTVRSNNIVKELAFEEAEEMAFRYGNVVDAELEIAMDAARTLSETFEGMKNSGITNRAQSNAILKRILEENSTFIGVWTCWEPNAFDGRDAEFVNALGHDQSGRYIPYWNRSNGKLVLDPLVDYQKEGAGDYYQLPKKTGQETILEPYSYMIGGREILITSLAVPIKYEGRLVGVAGVDMELDIFENLIKDIEIYESGYTALLSNKGTIVAHVDERQVGANLLNRGNLEQRRQYLDAVKKGEVNTGIDKSVVLGEEVFRVFTPVNIGKARSTWSFYVNAPVSEILKPARNTRNFIIIIGIISIPILVILIIFIANNIASTIKEAVGIISTASTEIASTIEQHERTASQQSASVNETTTTMEELGTSSRQSAEQTESAARESQLVLELAEKGTEDMTKSKEVVEDLKLKVKDIAEQILHLSDQIGRISNVTSIVRNIASQVNLLALNASVEAARAGEQGKGFGVVATEIRKLADQSKKSAENIDSLIGDIQKSTNSTVMVTEEGTNRVDEVAKTAEETLQSFIAIFDSATKASESVQQISMNIQQQAAAVKQVVQAMNSINIGVKETATGIKQTKIGVQRVNEGTKNLNEMV